MSVEPGGGDDPSRTPGDSPEMDAKLVVVGRAMASVVERARRLKMSSLEGYDYPGGKSSSSATPSVSARTTNSGGRYGRRPGMSGRSTQSGAQRNTATGGGGGSSTVRRLKKIDSAPYHRTPRSAQSLTGNLPVPPPPPPPSPRCPQARELFQALEQADKLMADYQQTEQLTDSLLRQAEAIKRDLELQCQLHRDVELVRDLEVEASGRSLLYLIEAIRAECDSEDVQAIRERCLQSLARSESRFAYQVDEMDGEDDDTDTNTNSETDTEADAEAMAEEDESASELEGADDRGNGKATQTDLEPMCSSDYRSSPKSSSSSSLRSGRSTLFYHMMHYVEDEILSNIPGEPAGLGLKMDMEPGAEPPDSVLPEAATGEEADLGAGDAREVAQDAVTKSDSI